MAKHVIGLVDCNNFYTSCEEIFCPSIADKPVVVLSNNDGCVIARSGKAKELGVRMGIPVFEINDLMKLHNIHVFSTNYALYGDISQRIINLLADLVPRIEVYSIDEAFIDLSHIPDNELTSFGSFVKQKIKQCTGIPVSIGIATTKTLAKVANHIAKSKNEYAGVLNMIGNSQSDHLLEMFPIDNVWGIGEKYKVYFQHVNIHTVMDLIQSDENRIREKLGIVGQRIVLELRGTMCYPLDQNPETKKEICTSRSFGKPIETYEKIEEATTSYIVKVAQKLRIQKSLANSMLVFIMTNKYADGPKYVNYKIVKFPSPTNQTAQLLRYGVSALKCIFRPGYKYKKSGVIVSDVIPDGAEQLSLWDSISPKDNLLTNTIDQINKKIGNEKIKYAIQGFGDSWKMRQHHLSPHYTTRWKDILEVEMDG